MDQQVPSLPYPQAERLGQRGRAGKRAEIPSRGQRLQELASRGQNSVHQSQHHGVSVIRGAEGGVGGGVGHPSQLRGKCLTWTTGADIFQHFISCEKGRKTTVGFRFLPAGSQGPTRRTTALSSSREEGFEESSVPPITSPIPTLNLEASPAAGPVPLSFHPRAALPLSQDQAAPATTPALASGPWSPTPSPAPRRPGGLTHWPGRWRHPGAAAAVARASGRAWPPWAVSPSRLLSGPGLGAARWLRGTGAHRQPRTHTCTFSGNGRPALGALFIRGPRPPAQGSS